MKKIKIHVSKKTLKRAVSVVVALGAEFCTLAVVSAVVNQNIDENTSKLEKNILGIGTILIGGLLGAEVAKYALEVTGLTETFAESFETEEKETHSDSNMEVSI